METPKTTNLAGDALREGPDTNENHERLFARVAPRIRRYFANNVRQAEAEELSQRTLLILERSLREKTYDPKRSFNTWAWLKARTVLAQWYRECGRGRPETLDADTRPKEQRGDSAVAEKLDAAHVLDEVKRRLGQETYDAFVLYYEEGLTQEEIGHVLERDRKTVRTRLKDAHALIRDLLDPDAPTS